MTARSPSSRYTTAQGGKNAIQASQLWGRTWDGGDITLGYEWYDDSPIKGKRQLQIDGATSRPGAWTTEFRSVLGHAGHHFHR